MEPRVCRFHLALLFLLPALFTGLSGCAYQGSRADADRRPEGAGAGKASLEPAGTSGWSSRDHGASTSARAGGARNSADSEDGAAMRSGSNDLWARVRRGLVLADIENPRVDAERQWFTRNQEYLDRVADRARLYMHYVVKEAEKRGLPTDLTLLPVIESAYQPFAYSPSHASGIWQFVPSTARLYGLKLTWWYDGRRDIVQSTRAAFDYLQKLHSDFNGDWLLAIAAYNWGEGNVQRAVDRNRRAGKPTDFWSLTLPDETSTYVPRLVALSSIVAHPARYGVALKSIPDQPYFEKVDLKGQIDLARAADMADMPVQKLYLLNPGLNHRATDPNGPYRLLVPADKADEFRKRVASLPLHFRVHWAHHHIRSGDTLGGIAMRYHTTVAVLKRMNRLHGNLIRAGGDMVVPVPAESTPTYARGSNAGGEIASAASPGPDLSASGASQSYTVRSGDTLWDIARKFGTSVKHLLALNGLHSNDVLHLGQNLTIRRAQPQRARAIPAVATMQENQRVRYTVRRGDSLWTISRRFGVPVTSLRRWNSLSARKYLQPGQHLDIYVSPENVPEQS